MRQITRETFEKGFDNGIFIINPLGLETLYSNSITRHINRSHWSMFFVWHPWGFLRWKQHDDDDVALHAANAKRRPLTHSCDFSALSTHHDTLRKLTLLRLFPFFSVSVLDIFSGISNKTTRVHTHWSKPFIEPEDEEESLREKNRRIYMYMYVCLFVCIENRERYAWMVVSPRMLEGKRMCLRSVPVPNKIRNQSDSESTKKSRQTERERSQVDKISVEKRNTHYEMKAERGKDRIFGDMRMWRERDEGQISVRKISVGIFLSDFHCYYQTMASRVLVRIHR